MFNRAVALGILVASTCLAVPVAAGSRSAVVDLRTNGTKISGAAEAGLLGYHVAGAGDVDGDGVPDVLVGSCRGGRFGPNSSGSVFVVFGWALRDGDIDLAQLGRRGFEIRGSRGRDGACAGAGVGDVNADGREDIIIGAPAAGLTGDSSGAAYVVFGKADPLPVSLASFDLAVSPLGSLRGGYRIRGPAPGAFAGHLAAGAGDVNQDGVPDLLIGALFARSVYVVFGDPEARQVDLSDLDGDDARLGYRIRTPFLGAAGAGALANAGDVNNDGYPDVVIGAPTGDPDRPGSAYIVFGRPRGPSVDLRSLGERGFQIRGMDGAGSFGRSVAAAGDQNGDAYEDVIVGGGNSAVVVLGARGAKDISIQHLGRRGFILNGRYGSALGYSVSVTDNVTMDQNPALLIGAPAPWVKTAGRMGAGAVYLLKGGSIPSLTDVDRLPRSAVMFLGASGRAKGCQGTPADCPGSRAGYSVAGVGDVTGDGKGDFLIGAPTENDRRGVVYLVSVSE